MAVLGIGFGLFMLSFLFSIGQIHKDEHYKEILIVITSILGALVFVFTSVLFL